MIPESQDFKLLKMFARRLSNDNRYMAYVLAVYEKHQGIDDVALAKKLGTFPEMVIRLSLYRRPSSGTANFEQQIHEFSENTLADLDSLREIISTVDRYENRASAFTTEANTLPRNLPEVLPGQIRSVQHFPFPVWSRMLAVTIGLIVVSWLSLVTWRHQPSTSPSTVISTQQIPNLTRDKARPEIESKSRPFSPQPNGKRARKFPRDELAIDLRTLGIEEGGNARSVGESAERALSPIDLPQAPFLLVITLRPEDPRGRYQVQLKDVFGQALQPPAEGHTRDGVLQLSFNLTQVPEGSYYLCLWRGDEVPRSFKVRVTARTASRN